MIAAAMLLKVTVILIVALVGTWFARRSRAAVRHALLAAAFFVILVLPIASVIVPSIQVPVPIAAQNVSPVIDAFVDQPASLPQQTESTSVATSAATESRWPSISTLLIGVWIAGTVLFLVPVVAGLLQ